MGSSRTRPWPERARTVSQDWIAWMPAEKDGIFDAAKAELEPFYSMLSVTLDQAFSLRNRGALWHASAHAEVSAQLCKRFATRLLAALNAIEEHGRHYGTLPNIVPLNSEFFRGETARHIARKNGLLSKILFSSRLKVFHKLQALREAVEELE